MRYAILIFAICLMLATIPTVQAQSAVVLVVDSLGSSYVYQDGMASYLSGGSIHKVYLNAVDEADARFTLTVPMPETEYGHSVIVTGYSNASAETLAYYNATVFDALHSQGYLCMGIMETGDSAEMLDSFDIAVREKNDSVYKPHFEVIMNDAYAPKDIVEMMKNYPTLRESKKGKDQNAAYIRYNNWSLDFAMDLVSYMNDSELGVNYFLLANVGGLDEAGHNLGSDGYEAVLAGLDPGLQGLIDACRGSNVTLIITADHGMSFKNTTSKGSHASESVAFRNESKLVPLLIYSSNKDVKGSGLYEQQDVAPTLLSLLDCPNTLSMCDGEPLPIKEKPTLYLRSKQPANVTVTGPGVLDAISFNGIYAIRSLDQGKYSIHNGGYEKDIDLRFDTLIDVPGDGQAGPALPSWAAYAAAGVVSITGILAALRFVWRK